MYMRTLLYKLYLIFPYNTRKGLKIAVKVWSVNAEGFYSGQLPTTYEDGWLTFHIGDENNPACYYLLVKD